MFQILPVLRAYNIRIGVITNNGFWTPLKQRSVILDDLHKQFEIVNESCRLGVRKPNSKIYLVSYFLENKYC